MKRETSADIDAAAARWVARADRGPLTRTEERELAAWAAADPRRQGALARAQAVLACAERARGLGPDFGRVAAAPAPIPRRAVLGGLLAAGIAGVAGTGAWWLTQAAGLRTAKGEIRLVPLPDGSSVTLNTASFVRVSFDEVRRSVDLVAGEALFDVARDAKRPFVVRAGDTVIRAIGTSFTVRHLDGGAVRVVVREGVVQIETPRTDVRPVRAAANTVAVAEPARQVEVVPQPPAETVRQLAWREGMLALDGLSLAAAAVEFARYSDVRIVIDDPALAGETVAGLFAAHDPRGFAKAVAVSFDARVVLDGDRIHLSR